MSQDLPAGMPIEGAASSSSVSQPASPPLPKPAEPASDGSQGRRGRRNRGQEKKKKGSLLKELPVLLVVAFVLALLIKAFLVQAFFIPSGSMETTLHGCPGCAGDRVLVNKVVYHFGDPQPGDIVVFRGTDSWAPEFQAKQPENFVEEALIGLGRAIGAAPPDEKDFVKRVVATGGQTVACCDAQGRVTVNGKSLDEPYISANTPVEFRPFGPVTVPAGRLWVMGDNRAGSADSRAHIDDGEMGTIPVDNVIGKASLIVWPFSRVTYLGSPNIQGLTAAGGVVGAPYALGLAAAVPLVGVRRRRRK